jgi:hypothetical protein
MKTRLMALVFALAGTLALSPITNEAAASPSDKVVAVDKVTAISVPIVGTITSGGTFNGTLDVTRFVSRQGQLFAIGTVTGTLTDAANNVIGTVTNIPVRLPVSNLNGSCQILHLELGPLDLDLLGLQVHLDKVVLDITAQSGPSNLLGNLLCAVANLLNGQGSLNSIAQLLNQILAIVNI